MNMSQKRQAQFDGYIWSVAYSYNSILSTAPNAIICKTWNDILNQKEKSSVSK